MIVNIYGCKENHLRDLPGVLAYIGTEISNIHYLHLSISIRLCRTKRKTSVY